MYNLFDDAALARLSTFVNSDLNPVTYLAIDPGKSNGVCGYDEKYYIQFMYTVPATDMTQFLAQFHKIKTCILEDFKLYPNKAKDQIYSDMETSRIIGRVETWAEMEKVNLIKQPASIKPTGYAWIGKKQPPKSNAANHQMDANVHFMYWAIKNNHINPAIVLNKDA
jgi:hypothetical protein